MSLQVTPLLLYFPPTFLNDTILTPVFILLWCLLVVGLCPCWPPSCGSVPVKYKQTMSVSNRRLLCFCFFGLWVANYPTCAAPVLPRGTTWSTLDLLQRRLNIFIGIYLKIMCGFVWNCIVVEVEVRCVCKWGSFFFFFAGRVSYPIFRSLFFIFDKNKARMNVSLTREW